MAISLVGLGSPSYGNNATVTPTLPTGLQAGDLLVAVTSIRLGTGRFNIPTGWSEITFEAPGTTVCVQVFYRWWQSGDGNPSFTVKTGGSNATTIGQVFGLRGVDTTTPFVKGDTTQYRWDQQPDAAASILYKDGSGNRPTLPAGYAVLHVGSYTNDLATWSYAESFTPTSATRVLSQAPLFTAESALGSDSCLAASLTSYSVDLKDPTNGTNTYLTTQLAPGISTTGGVAASYVLMPGATAPSHPFTGSGGVKAGGVAVTAKFSAPPPEHLYSGTGGAKVGGAADTAKLPGHPYDGSGGIKVGGAAATGKVGNTTPFGMTARYDVQAVGADMVSGTTITATINGTAAAVVSATITSSDNGAEYANIVIAGSAAIGSTLNVNAVYSLAGSASVAKPILSAASIVRARQLAGGLYAVEAYATPGTPRTPKDFTPAGISYRRSNMVRGAVDHYVKPGDRDSAGKTVREVVTFMALESPSFTEVYFYG